MPTLKGLRIVLVRPRVAGNVGAVARAAANFGAGELVVVSSRCEWRGEEAFERATGSAGELLRAAREEKTLQAALADCRAAVAFTRRLRTRERLARFTVVLEPLLRGSGAGLAPVALVFGNEKTGLSGRELLECTHQALIPTDPELPSLNLSHAVAIVLARLHELRETAQLAAERSPEVEEGQASVGELGALLDHWKEVLVDVGMDTGGNPERFLKGLTRFLRRSKVTSGELRLLRGFLSKTQVALGTRNRGRKAVP